MSDTVYDSISAATEVDLGISTVYDSAPDLGIGEGFEIAGEAFGQGLETVGEALGEGYAGTYECANATAPDLGVSQALGLDVSSRGLRFWENLADEESEMALALDLQRYQRDAIKRMLNLNSDVGGESGWDKDDVVDSPENWKVLVYDLFCRDLISPLLKVGELKAMNVTLYMMLHSDRDTIPVRAAAPPVPSMRCLLNA